MTPTELKLLARVQALELLVQHLLWLAAQKDQSRLDTYAKHLDQELSLGYMKGIADPAMGDQLVAETQDAVARIIQGLQAKVSAQITRGKTDRNPRK